jgi:hypothetical protein
MLRSPLLKVTHKGELAFQFRFLVWRWRGILCILEGGKVFFFV